MRGFEPPLKRVARKITIVPPPHFEACCLSASLWFELILKRLSLVELIFMRRTCKTFAKLKALKYFIQDKEYSAFDDAPKRYWNRIATPYANELRDILEKGVFSLFITWESIVTPANSPLYASYGIFSNKELLLRSLSTYTIQNAQVDVSEKKVLIQMWDVDAQRVTFTIRGANEEIIKAMI